MKKYIPLILILLIFLSCGSGKKKVVTIWSDIPEIAMYTEQYNALEGGERYVVEYKENPVSALSEEELHPDLVISRNLHNPESEKLFSPLNSLAIKSGIPIETIYSGFIRSCEKDDELYTIPLSFNLPGIIFLSDIIPESRAFFYLSPEEIQAYADPFNQKRGESFTNMGFSPLWNPEFLLTTSWGFDARFRAGGEYIRWNTSALSHALSFQRHWIEESAGSIDAALEFMEKYLFEPKYKLIKEGRIRFAYMDSREFFNLPESRRNGLDIRWYEVDGKIPVVKDTVYAAVPIAAKQKKEGAAYIKWLLMPKTQKMLITSLRDAGIPSFGFAQGFSSVAEINQRYFPEIYPFLLGKIPADRDLTYPEVLPKSWPLLKEEVIKPWIAAAVSEAPEAKQEELSQNIKTWLLQGGAY